MFAIGALSGDCSAIITLETLALCKKQQQNKMGGASGYSTAKWKTSIKYL